MLFKREYFYTAEAMRKDDNGTVKFDGAMVIHSPFTSVIGQITKLKKAVDKELGDEYDPCVITYIQKVN